MVTAQGLNTLDTNSPKAMHTAANPNRNSTDMLILVILLI
jgi:hypothetical protein